MNITKKFHSYIKKFLLITADFEDEITTEVEMFFDFIKPLWAKLNFMTYLDKYKGIKEVRRDYNRITLKSSSFKQLIFEPRILLFNFSNKKLFDVAGITTKGEIINEEGELRIETPILICPHESKYSVNEKKRTETIINLLEYEQVFLIEKYVRQIEGIYQKNNSKYKITSDMKINSKEERSRIEELIGFYDLLQNKKFQKPF